jgi:hypothetical protein
VNITHINRKRFASALGAVVVAAAVPAVLFVGAGAAQAPPPAPTAIQSLPQVRPGDLPLGPVGAPPDCKAKLQAAADAQTALTNASNQYGAAVKEQFNAQQTFDFDRKGPFWNSHRAPIDDPASTGDGGLNSVGLVTVGQYDTGRLDRANQKVADLKPIVLADLTTRNNTATAAQGC